MCERFRNENGHVRVFVVDPHLENRLRQFTGDGRVTLPATALEALISHLRQQWETVAMQDQEVALLVEGSLRRPMRRVIERALPELACISYREIPSDLMIEPISILKLESVFGDESNTPQGMIPGTQPTPNETSLENSAA